MCGVSICKGRCNEKVVSIDCIYTYVFLVVLLLVNYQQASTMNIQSIRGSGAVVNRFEELAQQGFILYVTCSEKRDHLQKL